MSTTAKWASRIVIFLFAAFWSTLTAIGLLWRWYKSGWKDDFWKVKPHARPRVLDGWNEDFVQLEVSSHCFPSPSEQHSPTLRMGRGQIASPSSPGSRLPRILVLVEIPAPLLRALLLVGRFSLHEA